MSEIELDKLDRQVLMALQGDLDDSPEPYAAIADALDTTEDEVIRRVKKMKADGIIRRIGAMIRHIEAGISFNGMVVWRVAPERLEEVGRRLAEFPEVTHCYERVPFGEKGGSLFSMVHAASEEGCLETVRRLSEAVGVPEYEVLFSRRELKKVSMTYFDDGAANDG